MKHGWNTDKKGRRREGCLPVYSIRVASVAVIAFAFQRQPKFQRHVNWRPSTPKRFTKPAQMLLKNLPQRLRMQVIIVLKLQRQRVPIACGLQRRLDAELLDLIEIELPLLAKESTMESIGFLGAQNPRPATRRNPHANSSPDCPT